LPAPRKRTSACARFPGEGSGHRPFFGKHTQSQACIYIYKLADIGIGVPKEMIRLTAKIFR